MSNRRNFVILTWLEPGQPIVLVQQWQWHWQWSRSGRQTAWLLSLGSLSGAPRSQGTCVPEPCAACCQGSLCSLCKYYIVLKTFIREHNGLLTFCWCRCYSWCQRGPGEWGSERRQMQPAASQSQAGAVRTWAGPQPVKIWSFFSFPINVRTYVEDADDSKNLSHISLNRYARKLLS